MREKLYDTAKPVKRAHGGVRAPHKKFTAEKDSVRMPPPEKVCISMQQHIGAPCIPTVKKGDAVFVGTVVGKQRQACFGARSFQRFGNG